MYVIEQKHIIKGPHFDLHQYTSSFKLNVAPCLRTYFCECFHFSPVTFWTSHTCIISLSIIWTGAANYINVLIAFHFLSLLWSLINLHWRMPAEPCVFVTTRWVVVLRTCCSSQVPSRCPTDSHGFGSWSVQSGAPVWHSIQCYHTALHALCQARTFQRARIVTVRNPVSFCLSPHAKRLNPLIRATLQPANRSRPQT